jgi:chemotaxis response regulator CheB
MKRILVVDDSVALRGSVCALLAQEFPGAIVGEAAAALPALALVAEEHWDLVLLDLSLPDRGGVETLRDLRTLRPNPPVVVMKPARRGGVSRGDARGGCHRLHLEGKLGQIDRGHHSNGPWCRVTKKQRSKGEISRRAGR